MADDALSGSAGNSAPALDKARVAKKRFLDLTHKELRVEGFGPK